MKRFLIIVIVLIATSKSFSQTDTVRISRFQALATIHELLACDLTKREVKILDMTLKQQVIMLDVKKDEINSLYSEIQKRDDLLDLKSLQIDQSKELNDLFRKELQKEKFKKSLNKYIYLGIGLAGGYFIASGVRN